MPDDMTSHPLPSIAVWQTIADMSGGTVGSRVRAKEVLDRAPSWVNPIQAYTYLSDLATAGALKRVGHGIYELRRLPDGYDTVAASRPAEAMSAVAAALTPMRNPPPLRYSAERIPVAIPIRPRFERPMDRRCDCGVVFTAVYFDQIGCEGCVE